MDADVDMPPRMDQNEMTTSDCFQVLESFYRSSNPATQPIQSFNRFIEQGVRRVIKDHSLIEHMDELNRTLVRVHLSSEDITFTRPRSERVSVQVPVDENGRPISRAEAAARSATTAHEEASDDDDEEQSHQKRTKNDIPVHTVTKIRHRMLYPTEARLRKMTLEARVYTKVTVERFALLENTAEPQLIERAVLPDMQLASIPVMVGSVLCSTTRDTDDLDPDEVEEHQCALLRECSYDYGGYFIVKGAEKVLIAQEKLAPNTIYVFPAKITTNNGRNPFEALGGGAPATATTSRGHVDHERGVVREAGGKPPLQPHNAEIMSVEPDSGNPSVQKLKIVALPMRSNTLWNPSGENANKEVQNRNMQTYKLVLMCVFTGLDSGARIPLPIMLRALGIDKELQMVMLICKNGALFEHLDEDTREREPDTSSICDLIEPTISMCRSMIEREQCIDYIMKRMARFSNGRSRNQRLETGVNFMTKNLLPHIKGTKGLLVRKGRFLCEMANRLCRCILSLDASTDRDAMQNKRLDTAGSLMQSLFSQYMLQLRKRMQVDLRKGAFRRGARGKKKGGGRSSTASGGGQAGGGSRGGGRGAAAALTRASTAGGQSIVSGVREFFQRISTNQNLMRYALSTGNWCIYSKDSYQLGEAYKGISQTMTMLNYHAKQSCLNRINTPVGEQTKNTKVRALHSTHWGLICPCKTPEGGQIGLVKNLSTVAHVSMQVSNAAMLYYIQSMAEVDFTQFGICDERLHIELFETSDDTVDPSNMRYLSMAMNSTPIELNGDIIGITSTPGDFVEAFRFFRRFGRLLFPDEKSRHLPLDASIAFEVKQNTVSVRSDGGRLCRPLFLVHPCDTKRLFMDQAFVQYVQNATLREKFGYGLDGLENGKDDNEYFVWEANDPMEHDSDDEPDEDLESAPCSNSVDEEDDAMPSSNDKNNAARDKNRRLVKREHERKQLRRRNTYRYIKRSIMHWVCEKGRRLYWADLFVCGMLEFLDTAETQVSMISMWPADLLNQAYCKSYTHCEVHPSTILSVSASLIPFPHHNQAPRNVYQCIAADEMVLMADRTTKTIGSLCVGDEIVTFDPATMVESTTTVKHHLVEQTHKQMYRIETDDGRTIRATFDHKFRTSDGWVEVQHFDIGTTLVASYANHVGRFEKFQTYKRQNDFVFVPIKSITPIESCVIADITTESDTHCFLAGNGLFGVHNSAMGDQAQGIATTREKYRIDTNGYQLWYPQKPLCTTKQATELNYQEMPQGVNAIVAIMVHGGYNQEDSVLMNQSAIDRGLFRSYASTTITDVCRTQYEHNREDSTNIQMEQFEKPKREEVYGMRRGNYEKLDKQGLPQVGMRYFKDDVIIGKVRLHEEQVKITKRGRFMHRKTDASIFWKKEMPAICDTVFITTNERNERMVHVKMRQMREPQIGDKFCLTPDHQVLTATRGWVPIADVTLEDEVATLDRSTHTFKYERPQEIQSFDHEGTMYEIHRPECSTMMTPEHKLYVRHCSINGYRRLCEAKQLASSNKQVFIPKTAKNPHGNRDELAPFGEEFASDTVPSEDFLFLLGIWFVIGQRVQVRNEQTNFKRYTSAISFNRAYNAASLVAGLCERCSIECTQFDVDAEIDKLTQKKKRQQGHVLISHKKNPKLYMTDPRMIALLDECGPVRGAHRFPELVWTLGAQNCKRVLEGVCVAMHKTVNKNGVYNLAMQSDMECDELQRLCFHAGAIADIHTHQVYAKRVQFQQSQRVLVERRHLHVRFSKAASHARILPEYDMRKHDSYKGSVHCLTVASHVFYVRRNGKCMWTGNSSRHGQKGTVGMTYRQEDMPFTASGIVPDIVVNPHAIPSRMTIGQLVECLCGKVATTGSQTQEVDATAFSELTVQEVTEQLQKNGFQKYGNERLYSGFTGKPIEAMVFMGPTYYQRLRHMVDDKIQARERGPVDELTRQPTHGKAKGGGLRFGEMERDCILAHGGTSFLQDRMLFNSDKYQVHVCDMCGLFCMNNNRNGRRFCKGCNNTTKISKVQLPYACKLLFQELMAMGIAPRIQTRGFVANRLGTTNGLIGDAR